MSRFPKLIIIATVMMIASILAPTIASAADIWLITTLRVNGVATQPNYYMNIWPGVMPDWANTYLHVNNKVQGRMRLRFNDVGGTVQSINYGITQYDPYFAGDTGVGWYARVQGSLSVFCYQGNTDGDGKGCQARTSGIVEEDAWH